MRTASLQTIKLFKREDVPVSLGLIIDNSGSMREKRTAVESAALALVRDSNKQDEVFVVNFNDEAYLDTDFTNDIAKMEQGLTKIDSRGGTAMRDAIRMSIDHLKDKGKRDKKVILVVTDGNDNASNVALEALVRLAQQDDVLIYAIGLLSDEEKREAGKAKRALGSWSRARAARCFIPRRYPRWRRSRTRWRTTSATSTRSRTRPRTRRWTGRSGRSRSW